MVVFLYGWCMDDPILFCQAPHASLEAGHVNNTNQHNESVAFWYRIPIKGHAILAYLAVCRSTGTGWTSLSQKSKELGEDEAL